jgi:hypothetical protein
LRTRVAPAWESIRDFINRLPARNRRHAAPVLGSTKGAGEKKRLMTERKARTQTTTQIDAAGRSSGASVAEYEHVCLGLLFLKYISDAF